MNDGKEITPISDAEGEALMRRLESGEQTDLSVEERAYLVKELAKHHQEVQDLLVDQLMKANTMSQESRAQESQEFAVGLRDRYFPDAYDALDKAIADTAAHISNMAAKDIGDIASFSAMHEYLTERASQALDFYEYEGYQALAKYFES